MLFIGLALARLRFSQRADTKKQTKCNGEATVRRSFVLTQTPPNCCLLWCWLSSHQPNHRSQANELVRGLPVSVGGGRKFFSFAEDRHTCTRNTQHQQRHKHKMTLEGLSDTRCFPHYHPSCTSSGTHHGRLTQLPPLLDFAMINRLSLPPPLPPLLSFPLLALARCLDRSVGSCGCTTRLLLRCPLLLLLWRWRHHGATHNATKDIAERSREIPTEHHGH